MAAPSEKGGNEAPNYQGKENISLVGTDCSFLRQLGKRDRNLEQL